MNSKMAGYALFAGLCMLIGYHIGEAIQWRIDKDDIDKQTKDLTDEYNAKVLDLVNERNFLMALYEVTKYESD